MCCRENGCNAATLMMMSTKTILKKNDTDLNSNVTGPWHLLHLKYRKNILTVRALYYVKFMSAN